ncbi:MAG: GrpB family protein [Chloroflexi bacterium]|nr:GrpB family protein [Chloroflexota bacterium]
MRVDSADKWQSLGAPEGRVEIVDYGPAWPRIFEREAAAIFEACRPWVTDVHHIGSTAVPGLAAKPILDVMPVVSSPVEGLGVVSRVSALGYRYRGENGIAGRFYFDRAVDGRTVAHVHMLPTGHPEIRRMLVFRDYVRTHRKAARDYARLKRELASRYGDDPRAYTDAKADFIHRAIDAATHQPASPEAELS